MSNKVFNIWVFGDAHVGTDLKRGVESLANALRDSEQGGTAGGPRFDWDIAIDVGDMSGGQSVPEDSEGIEVVRQFGTLRYHPREAIYGVCGNHDRSGLTEPPARWWRMWIDPMGDSPETSDVDNSKRPFPIEGTWERYHFRVGNLLFLMMSDINEPTQKIGRGDLGGNPGGVVSGETFQWWKEMIESNSDSIIVSVHHYMLKNTTVASGDWEGMNKDSDGNWINGYHGYKPEGTPIGASYLYFVDSKPDSGAFETYLRFNPEAVALWLGGHTHTHPDNTHGNKAKLEQKWGTWFLNAAALTRYHVNGDSLPQSSMLTFTEGSPEVTIRCYMHTDEILPQGWYEKAENTFTLDQSFQQQTQS